MRPRGAGSVGYVKGSRFVYIWYRVNGRLVRESTKQTSKEKAERLLQRRIAEADAGQPIAQDVKRVRYEGIRDALLADYKIHDRSSLVPRADGTRTIIGLTHTDPFFAGRPVASITTSLLQEFVQKRKADGASNSTINRNLALLRRMMTLAKRDGKLHTVPYFPMLRENDPRQGFLPPEDFARMRDAMQEDLRPMLCYLYFTGCRVGAAQKVTWSQVVFEDDAVFIRLLGSQTKNRRPLQLPLPDDLAGMLRLVTRREGPVFTATNLVKAFKKACVSAGLGRWRDPENHDAGYDGLLLHDLRRSGVRNLRRAGVSEDTAMKISGHKTRSTFARYNIVDDADLVDAMKKTQKFVTSSLQAASEKSAK
jgi:integrase